MPKGIPKYLGRPRRGIEVNGSKLTDKVVLKIRAAHAAGWTNAQISREYGIHWQWIGYICRGEAWTHVGGELTQRRPPMRVSQVRSIKRAIASGLECKEVAQIHGLSYSDVWRIGAGRRWASVRP